MRRCGNCNKEDRPWFEDAPCSCGVAQLDDPAPRNHAPDCRSLGHDVVVYPVRVSPSDLTFDGKLGSYYTERGWRLQRNGNRFYRMKMLCRDCVEAENGAQARRREYLKASRAALGIETMTYAQMLAQQ